MWINTYIQHTITALLADILTSTIFALGQIRLKHDGERKLQHFARKYGYKIADGTIIALLIVFVVVILHRCQMGNLQQNSTFRPVTNPQTKGHPDVFNSIVRDTSTTLKTKLVLIDNLIKTGFDLNNKGSYDDFPSIFSPMDSLLIAGTAELANELLDRGLSVDSSIRQCNDQYWFTQGALMRTGGAGLDVLKVLVEAGFNEHCIKNETNSGLVCGIMYVSHLRDDEQVPLAVDIVKYLAKQGFDINAKCNGETMLEFLQKERNSVIFTTDDINSRQIRLLPVINTLKSLSSG